MNEPNVPFEALLARAGWLQRLAVELVGDPDSARDLVQATWLRALRRPPRAGVPVRAWLARVLRNEARQTWRAARSRVEREEARGPGAPSEAADEVVARGQAQRRLVEAVLALDERYGAVLLLRYYDGLAPRAIAERLGLPASTVRTRLQRGLAALRAELEARHGDDARTWLAALAFGAPENAPAARTAPLAGAGALVAAAVVAIPLALVAWLPGAAEAVGLGAPRETTELAGRRRAPRAVTTARPARAESEASERRVAAAGAPRPGEPTDVDAAPAQPLAVRVRIDGRPAPRGTVLLSRGGWIRSDPRELAAELRAPLEPDGAARFPSFAGRPRVIAAELAGGDLLQRALRGPDAEPALELGTSRLEGTLYRADGRPAAEVTVTLGMRRGYDYGALTAFRQTDARGRFSLDHLPAGGFWLHAERDGETVRVHGELERGERREVTLGTPRPAVRLAGRVVTPGGAPHVGHPPRTTGRVELVREDGRGREVHPVPLGRDGRFEVRLAPGVYEVRVFPHSAERAVTLERLELLEDGERELVLPGARVEGRAFVAGLGRAFDPEGDGALALALEASGGDARHEAGVGAEGEFVFDGVADGLWTLTGARLAEPAPVRVLVQDGQAAQVDVLVRGGGAR